MIRKNLWSWNSILAILTTRVIFSMKIVNQLAPGSVEDYVMRRSRINLPFALLQLTVIDFST